MSLRDIRKPLQDSTIYNPKKYYTYVLSTTKEMCQLALLSDYIQELGRLKRKVELGLCAEIVPSSRKSARK